MPTKRDKLGGTGDLRRTLTDQDTIATLRKVRELAKQHPAVAYPRRETEALISAPNEKYYTARISDLPAPWLNIFLNFVSQSAYDLGLRSRLLCDFDTDPIAVDVRCDGSISACEKFKTYIEWVLDYIKNEATKAGRL